MHFILFGPRLMLVHSDCDKHKLCEIVQYLAIKKCRDLANLYLLYCVVYFGAGSAIFNIETAKIFRPSLILNNWDIKSVGPNRLSTLL